ncbi:hypothetical protein GN316_15410 [Xylophilus sp. Kf1]|nr:hypothetical protein [Xylophilus sp. Kf1]
MTCRYSGADWRDEIYNAVRQTPGGVKAAAAFLTERRGRSIHPETLRAKLRHVDGESISMEMAEMLTEWLQEMCRPDALSWIHAFNGRFGMAADTLDAQPAGGWPNEVTALCDKLLHLGVAGGRLTELGLKAAADGLIDEAEADAITEQAMAEIRLLFRLTRNAQRAANSPRTGG